jgi:hypothetical protein
MHCLVPCGAGFILRRASARLWNSIGVAACLLLTVGPAAAQDLPEVRLLILAPSPYTHRHDSFRAGCGILLSLRRVVHEHKLPLRTTYYDAAPALENAEKAKHLVRGARVLVIGGSTWAQGSSYFVRRFFELVDTEDLAGVAASAWTTSGGTHTGGDVVIADTLRTLMGMGAQVFSLGQKAMVFPTGERLEPKAEGEFTLLDCWFMEQFARNIALVALAGGNPRKSHELEKELNFTPIYWKQFPKDEASIALRFRGLRDQLNAAADEKSESYRKLRSLVE